MSKSIPDYLKLHIEEETTSSTPAPAPVRPLIERLFLGLEAATGWLISEETGWQQSSKNNGGRRFTTRQGGLRLKQTASPPRCPAEDMYDLASAVAELLDQWHSSRTQLKRYEAELAATVPVLVSQDDSRHLAQRLEAILGGLVAGMDATAASIYLLNESTSELKLRAQWGLPENRWTEAPRPLRGAVADLEALTGHAVVIEDTRLLRHWNIPEEFAAAVCVPVSTPTVPLGTLWLFNATPRDYSLRETNLIEIVAGRIATELERESLVRDVYQLRQSGATLPAAARSRRNSPSQPPAPLIPGWDVALSNGWPDRQSYDWADWQLSPSNLLSFAMGTGYRGAKADAMVSGEAHGALWTQLTQDHDPRAVLEQVNQLLWHTGPGDQTAHLAAGKLDVSTGTLQLATAGYAEAYILRPHGWEPTNEHSPAAGESPDQLYASCRYRLEPGDILCVSCQPPTDPTSEYGPAIAELLLHNTHLTAAQLTEVYERKFASKWPLLVIKRN